MSGTAMNQRYHEDTELQLGRSRMVAEEKYMRQREVRVTRQHQELLETKSRMRSAFHIQTFPAISSPPRYVYM